MMVVLFIVALLATIAIPNYTRHTRRAKASEAVATMTMIRQAMRDYFINNGTYYDVAPGNVADPAGINELPVTGVGIDVGVAQYFSNKAFLVTTTLTSPRFTSPGPVDFVITAIGSASELCGTVDCAVYNTSVTLYRLEMDNTGRTFVSYDHDGTLGNWNSY